MEKQKKKKCVKRKGPDGRCALCGEKGQFPANYPQVMCHGCGEFGHYAAECRKPPVRWWCGSDGHRKSECPVKQSVRKKKQAPSAEGGSERPSESKKPMAAPAACGTSYAAVATARGGQPQRAGTSMGSVLAERLETGLRLLVGVRDTSIYYTRKLEELAEEEEELEEAYVERKKRISLQRAALRREAEFARRWAPSIMMMLQESQRMSVRVDPTEVGKARNQHTRMASKASKATQQKGAEGGQGLSQSPRQEPVTQRKNGEKGKTPQHTNKAGTVKENIPSDTESTHESGGDSPVTSETGSLL